MQHYTTIPTPAKHRPANLLRRIRDFLLQKFWLPRVVYEALPYLYLALGLAAVAAAIYVPDWAWILPYAILLGLTCLHAGLAIVTLRYRYRRERGARQTTPQGTDLP